MLWLIAALGSISFQNTFLESQRKYERVRVAIQEKKAIVEKTLQTSGITIATLRLLIVAYKDEDILELYARDLNSVSYTKICTYSICARSGELGYKKQAGDYQVPEGFYYIDRFNPKSNFYLSLGINYPNLADKHRNNTQHLGGDIFIHGGCATIGCLPMTDSGIKEIYLYAILAKNNGQHNIPVYLFPFKMTEENFARYKEKYKNNPNLISFWENLKHGYDSFQSKKQEIKYKFSNLGNYQYE